MNDTNFQELAHDSMRQILSEIAPTISPVTLSPNDTLIEVAKLPFYDDFKLYSLTDLRLPAQNCHYVLYKPGFASLLDGTNESIYRVNERSSMKLGSDTLPAYVEFFFSFADSLARFEIMQKPEDIDLLPDATDKEKAEVAAKLMPIFCKGSDGNGLSTLTCTLLSKDELFQAEIKVAPHEMDVIDPESGTSEHFTVGHVKMSHPELLLWDLKISTEDDEDDKNADNEFSDPGEPVSSYSDIPPLDRLVFQNLLGEEAKKILTEISPGISPIALPADKTSVCVSHLPFYDEYKFYELTDETMPPPNTLYILYKPDSVIPMDGTNEPIYRANELAPIKLDPELLPAYAKFFSITSGGRWAGSLSSKARRK